jgi:membrane complex biogenesis BtpA family protein
MPQLLNEMFGVDKPVIAMAHIPALPGTPRYNPHRSIDDMISAVAVDVERLWAAGVDAVMFCNEDDRPYQLQAGPEAIAIMTRIVTELRPKDRPFGVDYLWDPIAALSIAAATGAAFIREVVTGVYESDMGLWAPDAAALLRLRRQVNAENIRIFANITPEFASTIGTRTIGQRARSAMVSSVVDGLLISGAMAGSEPDADALREAKDAVGADFPVLLNTGAKQDNIAKYLQFADGVIVGSSLKVDGHTWNSVDPARAQRFMETVKEVRGKRL